MVNNFVAERNHKVLYDKRDHVSNSTVHDPQKNLLHLFRSVQCVVCHDIALEP
jgi:hypothetical protein